MVVRKKARRTKTSHPGVKLRSRTWESGAVTHYARFVDPDKGEEVDVNLSKLKLTSEAARVDWARRKSISLTKRAANLAAGGAKYTETSLRDALASYMGKAPDSAPPLLTDLAEGAKAKRASTISACRPALDRFLTWADHRGIMSTDDLDEHNLAMFRTVLVGASRTAQVAGERRGSRVTSDRPLSKVSVNSYLKAIKAALNKLREVGLLPKVAHEETLTKALKRVKEPKHEPEILRAAEVRALVLACQKHDAAAFALSRDENAGLAAPGSKLRYHAITPFVAFVLLTGCRVTEALSLTWADVDLDALDDQGRAVGLVRVTADVSKTNEAREVMLDVSPILRRLLRALRVTSGGRGRVRVFPEITAPVAKASLRRLTMPELDASEANGKRRRRQRTPAPRFGAPAFGWHTLRRTCGTFLVCSPSIYGSAAVFLAAKRLGHSIEVAEKHYLNVVRGVDPKHRTLEDALGIADLLDGLVSRLAGETVGADAAGAVVSA